MCRFDLLMESQMQFDKYDKERKFQQDQQTVL